MHTSHLLVTGVGGHLGRLVAEQLIDAGATVPVVGTSRSPERLATLIRRGLTLRRADFDEPDALPAAFADAERMLLISTAAANAGPRRVRQHTQAIRAALQAGVRHIAYTSFLDADSTPLQALAADHASTEAELTQGPVGHSILRHAFYMEMLLTTLPPAIASGRLLSSNTRAGVAYVARADCASADAAALRDGFDGRRTLDITGGQAVSAAGLVRQLNDTLGTDIVAVDASRQDVAAHLAACGLPPPMAQMLAAIDEGLGRGAMARVSEDLERLTGARPTTVEAFLRDHRASLLAR
ncbi:NAD(P)H-binding protein [Roseateles chitinivorans]|uniref:NAD(P)H-binding protein n=1 Tax=Roseateles chitinivorans TaxID=2917965 RepID=UPI003D675714